MIRNLSILDSDGRSLVSSYFGECHSLGDNTNLISGFLSALHQMGQNLSGKGVDQISFGVLYFVLITERNLIFSVAADDGDIEANKVKLSQIADLFIERYGSILWDLDNRDDLSLFDEFVPYLLNLGVVAKSCGKYPDCMDCPDSKKTLPMEQVIQQTDNMDI
ncbi:MAG: hypothetical protein ACFE7R_04855 [Candidatus Hodarchaeota archaeon]